MKFEVLMRQTCQSSSLRTVDEKWGFSQLQYCKAHSLALTTRSLIQRLLLASSINNKQLRKMENKMCKYS